MTPREYYAIAAGRLESNQGELWKLATIGAWIHNAQPNFGKKKRKSVKPEDLFPSLKGMGRKGQQAQTPDEQLFLARIIHARFIGSRKSGKVK